MLDDGDTVKHANDPHIQMDQDDGSSTAGAMTSLAGDHVTGRADVGDDSSCSPSSVTIVDLDATIDDDRRLEDAEDDQGGSIALRVPTPSSWEKYRVVPAASSSHSTIRQSASDDTDVKVIVVADRRNEVLKDDVDRRSIKKPCSCGAMSADLQVIAVISSPCEQRDGK